MKYSFDVTGMSCAACSAAVERAVKALGIENPSVNLLSGVLKVDIDENTTSVTDIICAVTKAGFGIDKAKTAAEKRKILQQKAIKERKILFARLITSILIMIPLMYVSMGHMWGLPTPSLLDNPLILALTQLVLTIPILIINYKYFTNGIKHLFARTPNMDSLIAVGSIAALIYGLFAIYKIFDGDTHYIHDLYFETAAMIPTLVTIGKYLEGRSKAGTSKALDMLIDLTPKKAIVLRNGVEEEIDVSLLKETDTVIVKPGAGFPCDGIVISGESYADESSLTGESIPVYKCKDSLVSAGTVNKNGTLTVKTTKVGDETVISGIIRLVEEASGSKAPISRLADKISAIFVPLVILIAIATCAVWLLCGADFEFAFSRAICVLVISCPCSLGLATPLAVTVGTGVAASNGILIKNAAKLEQIGHVNTVLFDKTGTLTNGSPVVTDILPEEGLSDNEFLRLCASLENSSEHPLGSAVVAEAENRNLELYSVSAYTAIPGKGLRAVVDNTNYIAGNLSLLKENGVAIDGSITKTFEELSSLGKTVLFFAQESKYIGCIAVRDESKPDSKKAVDALKSMGVNCVMITGDNEITAKAIADKIGISEVCASVSPDEKEKYVRKYIDDGKTVAMCGDGINDSPALARADVGISVSKGTDIAIEAADIILMHSDVYSVPRAIALSRATISNIKLSLFWALLYNSLGIPIAAGVLFPAFGITLNPMIGAAAMSLSSICVVLNALRLRKFKYN